MAGTPPISARQIIAASLLIAVLIGCAKSTPASFRSIKEEMTSEQLARLSPAVQQLLTDVEAGKAGGELATKYSAALKEATRTTESKDGIHYLFVLDGHGEAESHPVIEVNVRAADGRVGECRTGIPAW